jgi:hypothetical protein
LQNWPLVGRPDVTQPSCEYHVLHATASTSLWHVAIALAEPHREQLVDSQFSKHAPADAQVPVRYGAAQRRTPVSAVNDTSNCARHVAQLALIVCSVMKNAWHPAVSGPVAQAAAASLRSVVPHTLWIVAVASVTPLGHDGYDAGHVPVCPAHARGFASTSHVPPVDEQLTHVAPPDPHEVSRNPASHVPAWSQQPVQLRGPHAAGVMHT